ncbi:multidrug resistance protein MdtA [Oxobacter pfennigii]|uniref:Multidrug resistance protein MdtA n=1 Tax=Oxobacter pfennigii TaxID=36849 RepID=A0A0P8W6S0_9CLOT|nr:HlyD family efflux transporter periplasmic adaptor subunit [Oxobacter pfennigii]KPU43742.1 multidrug resistance protein MdtA [Oxobacter pfennigii]
MKLNPKEGPVDISAGRMKTINKKNIAIIVVILIALIAAGIKFLPDIINKRSASNTDYDLRTDSVKRGEISTKISGSGSVKSSNREEVYSKVGATINKVYFKEGDRIQAGDLLMELDNSDALLTVEKNRSTLTQTQLSQQSNLDGINSLTVAAPFDGQVTDISVKEGSVISKNSVVLTLVDTSKLKLLLEFSSPGIADVTPGKSAIVYIQDFMEIVEGTVTYVSATPYSSPSGGILYSVEIQIENPGSLTEGMKASAEIETSVGLITSIDSSELEYTNKTELKTDGGTVDKVHVKAKQYVNEGQLLIEIENKDLLSSRDTTDIKLKELNEQLDSSIRQLDYYKIYSSTDGVIIQQEVNEGDTIKAADLLCVVADDQNMEFSINVDELDIEKIEVGQTVDVTVEALSDTAVRPLNGHVSKIAMEGTSSNGVTTYPVTIKIDKTDKLRSGMNADGDIFITRKTDVLHVPLQAIQRIGGSTYVMVQGTAEQIEEMKKNGTYIDIFAQRTPGAQGSPGGNSGGTGSGNNGTGNQGSTQARPNNSGASSGNTSLSQGGQGNFNAASGSQGSSRQITGSISSALRQYQEYYEKAFAIPTPVEIGLNDEDNVEIVSGLEEGDIVILPPMQSNTTQQGTTNMQRPQGGMAVPAGGGTMIRR